MLVILSAGRSGTNLALELFTGHSNFKVPEYSEDKLLFANRNILYPDNYLCKSDITYCPSYIEFNIFMIQNKNCKIIWTVRDVRDWVMSKIYRGYGVSQDSTIDGCKYSINKMFSIYKSAIVNFPDRIKVLRMEDILTNIESVCKELCQWLNIEFEKSMLTPHLRMRHTGKKKRYKTLDTSQIALYKNIETVYDGFFIKNNIPIIKLWKELNYINREFNYDTI